MTDEATFRALLAAPSLDRDALLIYADFLEDRGELARAAFVRAYRELAPLTHRHPELLDRGAALRELAKPLAPDWLAAFARPRLLGSVWAGTSMRTGIIMRFQDGGVLNYSQRTNTYANGTWQQIGMCIVLEINDHYADYDGVVVGDVIIGRATNITTTTWRWSLRATAKPEHVEYPVDRVVTQVYKHAAPRKKRKKR